jgi:hypothetical protein
MTSFDAGCGFGYALHWNSSRRLWLKSWGSYMGELVTLESGRRGPRWELLDQVVRAFVRYVYDPAAGLSLPMRR